MKVIISIINVFGQKTFETLVKKFGKDSTRSIKKINIEYFDKEQFQMQSHEVNGFVDK